MRILILSINIVVFFLMLFVALLFEGCKTLSAEDTQGINVSLYVSKPHLGGIVRAQVNEIIPYELTDGYIVIKANDFEAMSNYCLGRVADK